MKLKPSLMIFLISLSQFANAEVFTLYRHGDFTSNYREIINKIKEKQLQTNDELAFSGHTFNYNKLLGSGGTSVVIETTEGKALKFPLTPEISLFGGIDCYSKVDRDYLKDYYYTHEELNRLGLPIVPIDGDKSYSSRNSAGEFEFILMDKINIEMELKDFLKKQGAIEGIKKEKMWDELEKLLIRTYKLTNIDDLHSGNLIWDGEKWVLLDFGDGVSHFSFYNSDSQSESEYENHILTHIGLPNSYQKRFKKLTKTLRKQEVLRRKHM